MMSEKSIIQKVEFFIRNSAINKMDSDFYKNGGWEVIDLEISKAIQGLLELYKNIKEIEKTHQEENGKLRVELEQEKEKNKELEEKLKIATAMLTRGTYPEQNEGDNDFDRQFISKDKIKEKLELLKDILKAKEKDGNIYKQIPIEYLKGAIEQLEELLEEK